MGIKVVTVYAFSTENWKRPKEEIDAIIKLLKEYIIDGVNDGNVKINFIGDKSSLPKELVDLLVDAEEKTKEKTKILNIAFNYGGRNEIVNACNRLIKEGKTEITEDDISNSVYTASLPDPDLIVRTAGEYRLSNFLLWQSAYSEFYFTDVYWPDFDKKQLDLAIKSFYNRKRRFGGLDNKEVK
jgi:undecaprenyl diphosphate synthase